MRRTLVVFMLCCPPAASAQEMDVFGFNPRATAMGNVQAAADGDFTAVYYNPALLHGGSFGIGFTYEQPFFQTAALGAPRYGALAVHGLTDREGYTLGFALPLGGVFHDRVTIGFGLFAPKDGILLARMLDDNAATWYRYEDAPSQYQLAAGLSVQPLDWLSIGVGAQLLGNESGQADFTAQLGEKPTPGVIQTSELDTNTLGAAAPVVGVAVGPFAGFRAYGCWRGQAQETYTLPIDVGMGADYGSLNVAVNGTFHFTPDEFSLGASQALLGGKLLVAADLEYDLWSEAPPPVAQIAVQLPSSLAQLYSATINPQPAAASFFDTLTPRLGVEWRPIAALAVRGGWFFRPTFVAHPPPLPTGAVDDLYLDSDANVFSAGVGYALPDPLRLAHRLVLEAAVQVAVLGQRTYGQDNSSGRLAYTAGGVGLDVPIAVRYEF